MGESKDCALYLGVFVAERVLAGVFNSIARMPFGNPGYDFICNKGYKVDAKSACLKKHGLSNRWVFMIYNNKIADYFICLGFDNRENLEPQHVWIIPGSKVNHLKHLAIPSSDYGIEKWNQYERPTDKILACCDVMRSGNG